MTNTMTQSQSSKSIASEPLAVRGRSPKDRAMLQSIALRVGVYLLLGLVATSMILPFAWMVLTSLKPEREAGGTEWIPTHVDRGSMQVFGHTIPVPANYLQVFEKVHFKDYYLNSLFVASWVTFLQVVTSAMAAYAFSRIPWKWRDRVFLLYLATMMIPGVVLIIPNYQTMYWMNQHWQGWLDGYKCLIVPAAFSAFGTFLLRQFMLTIPASLDEAAEIDGASRFRIFWDIILPLARPGVITLAIFTFLGTYNSFFWPLITMRSDDKLTLPVGLLYFSGSYYQATHLLMAASVMSVVPLIALFIAMQKYMVKGIQLGAVKG